MTEQDTKNTQNLFEPEPITNGPILMVLLILLLGLLGGMYYWFEVIKRTPAPQAPAPLRPTAEQNREPESDTARAQTEALQVVSTSDEIPAIEADIESTNLDTLELELDAIEAELNSAL